MNLRTILVMIFSAVALLALTTGKLVAQTPAVFPPLFDAIRADDLAAAQAIVKKDKGAVSMAGYDGASFFDVTPLEFCVNQNKPNGVAIFTYLLQAGAPLDQPTHYKSPVVFTCTNRGREPYLRALLKFSRRQANARSPDASTPLHSAASQGFLEQVKMLLAAGAWVNVQNNVGDTPLLAMAFYANPNLTVVRLLIKHGANVTLTNAKGYTAPDLAERSGNAPFYRALTSKQ